jgi:hypothetical protein
VTPAASFSGFREKNEATALGIRTIGGNAIFSKCPFASIDMTPEQFGGFI